MRHNASLKVLKLKAQDKIELELLIACSLLSLDNSHWTRLGFDIDKVSLQAPKKASAYWKPHLTCSLPVLRGQDDINYAVFSFGVLLMEIEAGEVAEREVTDKVWRCNVTPPDSILERILNEWKRNVDKKYRKIATACLHFPRYCATFYDPEINESRNRIAAIYKYIVAPLFRLVAERFDDSLDRFNGFPSSAIANLISKDYTFGSPTFDTGIALFDGSGAASPTPE